VYALPDAPLARQAAASVHGLVSHQSAARHWKMEMLIADSTAHVTVSRSSRPPIISDVTWHFSEVDGRDDGYGVTSPLRTVLDCALYLPFAQALAIADSALHRELITSDELLRAAYARQGAGRQRMMRVADLANGRAANPFESGLRAILIDAEIEGFTPQCEIELPEGRIWVDLGDPQRRIALEADSFAFHGSPTTLTKDCRRYDELVSNGWLVLRFTYEHVTTEQDWIASTTIDTCTLRD
jgi:very-short-patch-repair endonuclease